MDLSAGFEHAVENIQLIHGVMKRLHIFPTNDDYQDYIQEAIIIYAESFQEYVENNNDLDKFNVYIFQKLIWRMTDFLRLEQKYSDANSLEVFDFDRVEQKNAVQFFEEVDLECLTEFEKQFFFDCFIQEIALTELTEKYHCGVRNLRYYRNSIREKLRKLFS